MIIGDVSNLDNLDISMSFELSYQQRLCYIM